MYTRGVLVDCVVVQCVSMEPCSLHLPACALVGLEVVGEPGGSAAGVAVGGQREWGKGVGAVLHTLSEFLGTGDWVGGVVVRALAEGCDQLVYVYFYPALVRQQLSAVVCG